MSGNFWEVQAEGIRPASLRQGNRPRLWLQSSVSSMCSRRASPGHAGALQVAGEAPHTKQNLGDNLLKSRLSLPHGPFTGKSTSVLPACSLDNTSPLPNALSCTVTLPQSPAFPCSPAHQQGPLHVPLILKGDVRTLGPPSCALGVQAFALAPRTRLQTPRSSSGKALLGLPAQCLAGKRFGERPFLASLSFRSSFRPLFFWSVLSTCP